MKSFESIARAAYEAFRQVRDGTADGLRTWEQLSPVARNAWIAAAQKMAEEIQQVH